MSQAVFEMTPYSTKPYRGFGMEGFTARWYAALTRKSLDQFQALARRVAQQLPARAQVLEVAPGPGYFAIELRKLGKYRLTGLDISRTFIDIARLNAVEAGVHVNFQQGDAARMPFEEESFDFLLCRAAFKNFAEPVRALQEMHRVLKPGGRALLIDLRKDASWASVRQAVEASRVGAWNSLVTKAIFRFMLLKRAYTRKEFEQFLSQTPFRRVDIQESPTTLELSLQRPLLSLHPA